MLWNRHSTRGQRGPKPELRSDERVPNSDLSPERLGMTAMRFVQQAAELIHDSERQASETFARSHDLAHRAAEQHELTERRIRDWKLEQRALEHSLDEANARAQKAEQMVRQSQAELAAMEQRLLAADHHGRYADERVIEVEQMLTRLEYLIHAHLFAKREPARTAIAA